MAKFEDFVATATAMGGNDLSRGWLKELWEGADSDMNRAINHLLDTPEDKYKRDSKKSFSSTSKPSGHKKSKRGNGSTGGGGGNVNTFSDYTSTGGLVGDRNHAGGGGGSAAANIPDLSSFFDFPQTSELDQSEQAPAGMAGISSGGTTGAGRTMMDGGQDKRGGAGATAMNANANHASMMGGAGAAPGGGLFGVASTMGGDMGMSMGGAGAGAYFGQQSMAPGMMGAQHQSMAGAHMNMSMAPPPLGTASSMAGGEQFPQAAVNFQQPNIHSMGAGAGNFAATIPPQGFAAAEHNNFHETPVMNNNPGGGMFGTTTPGAPGFFPQPPPGSAASGPGAGGALGPPPSSGSMLGTTSTTTLPPGMSSGQHPILADVLQMPPSVQQAMMQQLDPSYQHGPSYVPPPVAAAGPGAGAGAAAAPGLASGSYTTMNAAASTTQPHVLSPTHAWQQSGLPPVQHPLMSEAEKNFWLFQQNGFQLPGGLFQQNVPQSAPALGGGVAVGAGAPGPQQQLPASLGNLAPAQQAPMSAVDLGIMQQLHPGGGSFLVHPPPQQQVHQQQHMHQTIAPSSAAALTSAAQQPPSTPSAAQQLQQLQLLQAQQHNLNQQAALYSSLAQHPSGHPVSITTSAPGSPTATSLVRGSVEVGSPLAQQRQEHLQLQVMQQQKMLHNMRNIVLMQNSRLSSLKRKEPADGGSGSEPGGDAGAEEKDGGEWWTGGTLSGGAGGQALGGAESSKNPFADAAPSGRSASNTPRLSHRETVLRNQMKRSASLTPSRRVRGAAAGAWQLNPGSTWMQLAAETPPRGGAGAGAAMSNPRLALPFPGGTVGAQPQTQSILGSSHLAGRGVQSSAPPGGPFYVAQNQTQMEHLGSPQLVASMMPQSMQRSLSPAPPPWYYSSPYLPSQLPHSATQLTQSIPVAPYAGYGPAAQPMFAQSVFM
mmetsp:Transcript_24502/g.61641  ORF Transcript_24502/g.61641 Transcript_24502/m.61641 type:complete len:935 (+) Transcript_24502:474-3278(+)